MKIGFKCGRFNIIHHGHVHCLNECKRRCDQLIVLVHDKKGDDFVIPARERLYIIRNLRCVDKALMYKEDTEDEMLRGFRQISKPSDRLILFHDESLRGKNPLPGQNIVDEIIFIPRHPGISVTDLYGKIKGL